MDFFLNSRFITGFALGFFLCMLYSRKMASKGNG